MEEAENTTSISLEKTCNTLEEKVPEKKYHQDS